MAELTNSSTIQVHQHPGWKIEAGGFKLNTSTGAYSVNVITSDSSGLFGYLLTLRIVYEDNTYIDIASNTGYSNFSNTGVISTSELSKHTSFRLAINCTADGCPGWGGTSANGNPGYFLPDSPTWALAANVKMVWAGNDAYYPSDSRFRISENSISFVIESDQTITNIKTTVQIWNEDNSTTEGSSGEIIINADRLATSGASKILTISSSDWSGIVYAKCYLVSVSVYNGSVWSDTLWCYAKTANCKPVISMKKEQYFDWYLVEWSCNITSSVYAGYPTSSKGNLGYVINNAETNGGSVKCINVIPSTDVEFKLKVKANRYYDGEKFGSYTSSEEIVSIRTLTAAHVELGDFNFADIISYRLVNPSNRDCSVELYKETTNIWSDIKSGTIIDNIQTHSMTQEELDILYKLFGYSNSVYVTLKVITHGEYIEQTNETTVKCILTGNAKTCHIAIEENDVRRAKVYIGDSTNSARRCVVWIGDSNGKARRCI